MLDPETCKSYKELTRELKPDPIKFSAYYTLIFIFRRGAICATVAFIESSYFQLRLSLFINLSYFVWVLVAFPFVTKLVNGVELFCEWTILTANFSMILFKTETMDDKILGYAIVFLFLAGISGFMMLILRNFVIKIIKKLKQRKKPTSIIPNHQNASTIATDTYIGERYDELDYRNEESQQQDTFRKVNT